MEFDCPACGAPHAFPDDQVPDEGLVVACTRCASHITLNKQGLVGDTGAPAPAAQEPSMDDLGPATAALDAGEMGLGGAPSDQAAAPPMLSGAIDDRPTVRPPGPPAPADDGRPKIMPRPKKRRRGPPVKPVPSGGSPVVAAPPPPVGPAPADAGDDLPLLDSSALDSVSASVDRVEAGLAQGSSELETGLPDLSPPGEEPRGRLADAFDSAVGSGKAALGAAASAEIGASSDLPPGMAVPGFQPRGAVWNWTDLPRAFLGVLDLRRLLMATAGYWLALNSVVLFRWLGGLLGSTVARIFGYTSQGVLVAALAIVGAVMAHVCFRTIIEGKPASVSEGWAWTRQNLKSVVGVPVAFGVVIAGIGALQGVVGGLGRIPWAGPIVWGLLSPAVVLSSLAAGVVAVVGFYSLPLYVPVIYNEKTELVPTLKRIAELFKTKGAILVGYILAVTVAFVFVFGVTVFPAVHIARRLGTAVSAGAMGENFSTTLAYAMETSPFGVMSAFEIAPAMGADPTLGHRIGGILAGFGTSTMAAVLLAIFMLTYYTAGGIVYAIATGRRR